MYDSVDASALPVDAQLVAGYINGLYTWTAADWARFPNSVQVTISVTATGNADVLDVEKGDATPAQCPAWVKRQQSVGLAVPTIYCALSNMAAVQKACAGLTYTLWVADWTGVPHIPAGAVACQYAAKGTYDVSLCAAGWPA